LVNSLSAIFYFSRALALFAVSGIVIASAAKQSSAQCKRPLDCFVAEPVIGPRDFARSDGSSQ
jgi:hypothetical protein